jgi:hypothetical protein
MVWNHRGSPARTIPATGKINRRQLFTFFTTYDLESMIDYLPLNVTTDMWFMHDGAPPHRIRIVLDYLNHNFRNNWIGNNGPFLWPARSPDLNPLDYFLWGHLKTFVYKDPIENEGHLIDQINNACNIIRNKHNIFPGVRRSLIRRCNLCLDHNGQQFEQFL